MDETRTLLNEPTAVPLAYVGHQNAYVMGWKDCAKQFVALSLQKSYKDVKRTERGWAGHFIGSNTCRFRRNTLLECEDARIIVSTVGNDAILTLGKEQKWRYEVTTVGCGRYYETMVFHAEEDDAGYWDADVERQIWDCPLNWTVDYIGETSDQAANDMHEAIVDWFTKKLELGEKFEGTE